MVDASSDTERQVTLTLSHIWMCQCLNRFNKSYQGCHPKQKKTLLASGSHWLGGGWWWMVVGGGWWWMVDGGWWWLVVDGGWWLVVVVDGGWWWMVVGGG